MDLMEEFEQFEEDHSVYDIVIDEVPIWERIRNKLYNKIRQQYGVGKPHSTLDLNVSDYLSGVKLWLHNLFRRNPFLASPSDLLFVGLPRRIKESDGFWWDIYCDPIHEQCSFDSVHFEMPHQLEHKLPTKTDSIRYLELIRYSGTIQRKLGLHRISFSSEEKSRLSEIETAFYQRFSVNMDLQKKVKSVLQNRLARLWLYKLLLRRVNPNLVVIIKSSGKYTLIEACQYNNIPVVELQHGAIHPAHPVYSFRGKRTNSLFPDYFLTWGKFWKDSVEFPIPDSRVISVGYPYLEQSASQYEDIKSQEQIIFISQGTIGEQLSKFAIEVNQHPDISHNIVYKLHPGEYDRWREDYPWLVDVDFEIIDHSEFPLYKLFSESSIQVGVSSTAIYEGLEFDLDTYVFDCSESKVLDPLIEKGSAKAISSADDLASSFGKEANPFDSSYYFTKNALERTCQTLRCLADEGECYNLHQL